MFKVAESQNADHLASEYSIQFEFFTKLKAVLLGGYSASRWLVVPEAKPATDKRRRLDILVRDSTRNRWFAVELLRQGTPSSLQEHYQRSKLIAAWMCCFQQMRSEGTWLYTAASESLKPLYTADLKAREEALRCFQRMRTKGSYLWSILRCSCPRIIGGGYYMRVMGLSAIAGDARERVREVVEAIS
ncbi:hypothetical protein L7F22_059405 [Adiantum nelumboides]|nr:hypothetical protein [Adiantum nelumboides]